MRILLIILLTVLLISCNNTEVTNKEQNIFNQDSIVLSMKEKPIKLKAEQTIVEEFPDVAQRFLSAFNTKNMEQLEMFQYSDYGIAGLYNPGAFHVVYKFADMKELLGEGGNNDPLFLKEKLVICDLKYGKTPVYDCESGWDEEGCFWYDKAEVKLLEIYEATVEFDLVEENEHFRKDISDISSKITHVIYNTESVIGFYFGQIDNKWYLLCIDRIDPCSA